MKIAKEIVMTMIHHRLLPEFRFGDDNIEVTDALNIITEKLKPIHEALNAIEYLVITDDIALSYVRPSLALFEEA